MCITKAENKGKNEHQKKTMVFRYHSEHKTAAVEQKLLLYANDVTFWEFKYYTPGNVLI